MHIANLIFPRKSNSIYQGDVNLNGLTNSQQRKWDLWIQSFLIKLGVSVVCLFTLLKVWQWAANSGEPIPMKDYHGETPTTQRYLMTNEQWEREKIRLRKLGNSNY